MNEQYDNPLVSVVICTFNGERFLAEQLDSIIHQTYPNIEIIAVDDCSADNTFKILKKYQELHPKIKLFLNEKNLGYVKNFEKGMRAASGVYIAPSDQDDIWEKEKIAVLVSEIQNHEIVYCNSLLIDDVNNSLHKKLSDIKALKSFDNCLNYTIGNTAAGHAMLVTNELAERCFPFPEMIPHDYWLGFVATCRYPIKFVDKAMIRYRQHTQNVFGAVKVAGGKRLKKKFVKEERLSLIRERMQLQYLKCPGDLMPQKKVLHELTMSYASFSLHNNYKRMMLFFQNRRTILAFKKKSAFRKWLFCFKMFYKIK